MVSHGYRYDQFFTPKKWIPYFRYQRVRLGWRGEGAEGKVGGRGILNSPNSLDLVIIPMHGRVTGEARFFFFIKDVHGVVNRSLKPNPTMEGLSPN